MHLARAQFPLLRPFVTICSSTTRDLCPDSSTCTNVHFVRALRPHTEVSLGDCSYLNTCHRGECRYVHWVLEDPLDAPPLKAPPRVEAHEAGRDEPLPPQWINADLRSLDISVLGKYDVVVADPPWAIHQEVRTVLFASDFVP